MKTLQIYDPAMCCPTGVCGPNVDQRLVNLAADIAFLRRKGVAVERFNLGHQPEAFATNPLVVSEMGPAAEHLPLFIVDGVVRAKGETPDRSEFASWFGIDLDPASDPSRVELPMASAECCDGDSDGCC